MVLANKKILSYLKSKASIINQSSITTFYSNPQHINYIITDILDKKISSFETDTAIATSYELTFTFFILTNNNEK